MHKRFLLSSQTPVYPFTKQDTKREDYTFFIRYAVSKEAETMEWLTKLSNAIAYIEENLDKEISYDKAAGNSCRSTYYFQRMFSYVAGTPLSDYIRKTKNDPGCL